MLMGFAEHQATWTLDARHTVTLPHLFYFVSRARLQFIPLIDWLDGWNFRRQFHPMEGDCYVIIGSLVHWTNGRSPLLQRKLFQLEAKDYINFAVACSKDFYDSIRHYLTLKVGNKV